MESPRCFISYSWDSESHRAWVRKLATRLRECGIDAILDQFHLAPGTDLTKFMEKSVRESNFVLLVCTPNFAQKADAGVGGVGYEKAIVTGEIFADEEARYKFIPLLRGGDAKESLPSYLKSRLFLDFREDTVFESRLEELLRHLYSEPLHSRPSLGPKTYFKETAPPRLAPVQKPDPQQKITNNIGMEFVLIPRGYFSMGCRMSQKEIFNWFGGEEGWYDREKPYHLVKIERPFYLQTTPVTQGQWQMIMGSNPSLFHKCGDECPVEQVSWEDAKQFIKKLNQVEKTLSYRLPSEAEWEYACRAGSETEFCFGNNVHRLGEFAWFNENSDAKTHLVAQKNPNSWGLYDMHGNVLEWVEDAWHDTYEGAPVDGREWVDEPNDPASARVLRGGSWFSGARSCRSAGRGAYYPHTRNYVVGFRLSMSITLHFDELSI